MGLMMAILRAPELSATSKIDLICIMTKAPVRSSFVVRRAWFCSSFVVRRRTNHARTRRERRTANGERRTSRSHLGCLPHDPRERPAFPPAHRPRLHDGDGVARLGFVLLVVDHEGRRPALGFAVQPMPHLPLDRDDDALVHLVADDDADLFQLVSHILNPVAYPALFCRSTVFTRARSRRTVRIFSGASSCPMAFWIRIRNSWSVSSRSLPPSSSAARSRSSAAFIAFSPARSASRTW